MKCYLDDLGFADGVRIVPLKLLSGRLLPAVQTRVNGYKVSFVIWCFCKRQLAPVVIMLNDYYRANRLKTSTD